MYGIQKPSTLEMVLQACARAAAMHTNKGFRPGLACPMKVGIRRPTFITQLSRPYLASSIRGPRPEAIPAYNEDNWLAHSLIWPTTKQGCSAVGLGTASALAE